MFQPGTRWGYSCATDVLGRLVEVVSGQSLREFLTERILTPLGMTDTRWWVEPEEAERLAALYIPNATGGVTRFNAIGDEALREPTLYAGGGGLISTAADYHRFTQMLLGEGTYEGKRLLGSRTVRFMTRNHLPGGADLAELNTGGFAETILDGVGFGLGFAVVLDPVPGRGPNSPGQYY